MNILEAYLNRIQGNVQPGESFDQGKQRLITNELSNRPRYDITGERYGNTLQDDMFSIKNAGRIKDRHTPQSYDYYAMTTLEPETVENPYTLNQTGYGVINELVEQATPIQEKGRKKTIGDIPEWYDGLHAYDEFRPEDDSDYSAELINFYINQAAQNRINDLRNYGAGWHGLQDYTNEEGLPTPYHDTSGNTIADDMKYIKSGGKTYHAAGDQTPLSWNVFDNLSPATEEALGWYGIPDPENGVSVTDVLAAYQKQLREHPERIEERRKRLGFK